MATRHDYGSGGAYKMAQLSITDALMAKTVVINALTRMSPALNVVAWEFRHRYRRAVNIPFPQDVQDNLGTPSSILDVGCGIGNAHKALRQLGCEANYFGFDCSRYAIEEAKRDFDPNAYFEVNTFECFEPRDGRTFDLILMQEMIYHVRLAIVHKQLQRYQVMLNPGGRILIRIYHRRYEREDYGPAVLNCGAVVLSEDLYCISNFSRSPC